MILFELQCGRNHSFEAWFRDNATYDAQEKKGEIVCPVCGDTRVRKAPMAPRIGRSGKERRPEGAAARGPEAAEALARRAGQHYA
ncbi:MAG: DUF1178 family protein, partial [Rhodospirillaceae bacterium]|nr:DUF1178 family protein [Rhodospirillaceae bacterium]